MRESVLHVRNAHCVNRRRTLTPDRRPILTPALRVVAPAETGAAERERSSGGLGRRRADDSGVVLVS